MGPPLLQFKIPDVMEPAKHQRTCAHVHKENLALDGRIVSSNRPMESDYDANHDNHNGASRLAPRPHVNYSFSGRGTNDDNKSCQYFLPSTSPTISPRLTELDSSHLLSSITTTPADLPAYPPYDQNEDLTAASTWNERDQVSPVSASTQEALSATVIDLKATVLQPRNDQDELARAVHYHRARIDSGKGTTQHAIPILDGSTCDSSSSVHSVTIWSSLGREALESNEKIIPGLTDDASVFFECDLGKIKSSKTSKCYKHTAVIASLHLKDRTQCRCSAMLLHPSSPDLTSEPVWLIMFRSEGSLSLVQTLVSASDVDQPIVIRISDNIDAERNIAQNSARIQHGSSDRGASLLQTVAKRPKMLTSVHDIRTLCLDLAVERFPSVRAYVLKLVGPKFPFLLLTRTLRDRIAISLVRSGSLEILATCKSLHRHLASLVNRIGICRLTLGPDHLVQRVPNISKVQLRNIMNVSIQILRVQNPTTYQADRNSGLLKLFSGADVIRNKCEVAIVGIPGETFSFSQQFLHDLGSFIGFKQVVLNIASIPSSEDITQRSTSWRKHTQDMSWKDIHTAASLIEDSLGPFLLADYGAVFYPHNNEIRKQLLMGDQSPDANPRQLFMYVPGQPTGGRRIAHGPVMHMAPAPAIAPAPPPPPKHPALAPLPSQPNTAPLHVMAIQQAGLAQHAGTSATRQTRAPRHEERQRSCLTSQSVTKTHPQPRVQTTQAIAPGPRSSQKRQRTTSGNFAGAQGTAQSDTPRAAPSSGDPQVSHKGKPFVLHGCHYNNIRRLRDFATTTAATSAQGSRDKMGKGRLSGNRGLTVERVGVRRL